MRIISIYAAQHIEPAHIQEFFQKNLLHPSERPIACFDGFFYESKNERVGGLAFQDYLFISDKSVYLWARGSEKDFLDRFSIGAVSFAAKQKDKESSTLEITIERKDKKPVYIIFDLVPNEEADKLIMLHVLLETVIEENIGKNFLDEIPDEVSSKIYHVGLEACPPVDFEIHEQDDASFNAPSYQNSPFAGMSSQQSSGFGGGGMLDTLRNGFNSRNQDPTGNIGYGQNILEQFKSQQAIEGYQNQNPVNNPNFGMGGQGAPQPNPFGGGKPGNIASFVDNLNNSIGNPNELPENLPDIDFDSLKQLGVIAKDIFKSIPDEYKDQLKEDLRGIPLSIQKLPNNFADSVKAVNELLQNVSNNKQTQDFILQAIQTAVKSDGLIGAASKIFKSSVSNQGSSNQNNSQRSNDAVARHEGESNNSESIENTDDQIPSTKYRKKVKIGQANTSNSESEQKTTDSVKTEPEQIDEGATKRKKVKIKPSNV